MLKNPYTELLSGIIVPESTLRHVISSGNESTPKQKHIHFKAITAASLALILTAGIAAAVIIKGNGTETDGNDYYAFSLSVSAAGRDEELYATDNFEIHEFRAFITSEPEKDEQQICYSSGLRLECTGENIEKITLSVMNGAVSVVYFESSGSPVVSGAEDKKTYYGSEDPIQFDYHFTDTDDEQRKSMILQKEADISQGRDKIIKKNYRTVTLTADSLSDPYVNLYLTADSQDMEESRRAYWLEHFEAPEDVYSLRKYGTNIMREIYKAMLSNTDESSIEKYNGLIKKEVTESAKQMNEFVTDLGLGITCTVHFRNGASRQRIIKPEFKTMTFGEYDKKYLGQLPDPKEFPFIDTSRIVLEYRTTTN